MNNIGEIYIAKEDGVQASPYFEEALKEDTLINDQKLRVKLIGNYGHALLLARDYKNAEKQLNQALEMFKVAKSYSLLAHVYRLKSKMTQTLG